jgi:uncharacterized protein YceH (UPF0502 family)
MEPVLNDIEVRILGCLIEKEFTTPDYYPLTLNALTNACNQKSNRNPVVSFEETTVVRGLDELNKKGLAEKILRSDSRVPKYRHIFTDKLDMRASQTAVLCVLMLRGPQTAGEIRGRAERMHRFADIAEVEEVLTGFMDGEEPMVIKLPRQTGLKERRYMHLLSGILRVNESEKSIPEEAATIKVRTENDRISKLESDYAKLCRDFDELKQAFNELKSQFD